MKPIMELIDEIEQSNWYQHDADGSWMQIDNKLASTIKALREAVKALEKIADPTNERFYTVYMQIEEADRALQSIATELGVEK